MDRRNRHAKLYALAEEDEIYLMWKKTFELCMRDFHDYAEGIPQEIRSILFGYADAGRMMMQKLVNIACEKMEFIDEENLHKEQAC